MSWLSRRLGYGLTGFVDVDNPTEPLAVTINRQPGVWSYYAGTSGTVAVTAGQRVLSFTAHATNAGSLTINGGASVTIPANCSISFKIEGSLVAPTIIFTGTDAYFIQAVA